LTAGFLLAAPISGSLSDRFGARPFATGGMVLAAGSFVLLNILPVNFSYVWFALILLLNGIGMGLFASPNRAGIMNSLPPGQRGVGAGMTATFQNAATVLSIGVFFSLIILGLSDSLPQHLQSGLVAQGVPTSAAHQIAALPPVSTLFAALLGYNPIQTLLQQQGVAGSLSQQHLHFLTSRSFFPHLIATPFQHGLSVAFAFAIAACLIAAVGSWLRGGKYHYVEGAEHGVRVLPDRDGPRAAVASPVAGPSTVQPVRSASVVPEPRAPEPGPSQPGGDGGAVVRPPSGPGLRGLVSQAADRPVNDVRLTVIDGAGHQVARARTDADGRYDIAVPAPGHYLLIVQSTAFQPQAAAIDVGAHPVEYPIVLTGVAGLAGVVRIARQGPRAEVTVTVTDARGEVVAATRTAGDGAYEVAGLVPGTYTVVASAAGLRPAAAVVTVPSTGTQQHDIELISGGRLRGRVVGPAGRSLPDVLVRLTGPDGRELAAGRTDREGGYEFANLPAGDYTVVAASYPPVSAPLHLPDGRWQQHDFTLGDGTQGNSHSDNGYSGNGVGPHHETAHAKREHP
jgi:hypothetical protein